MTLAASMNLLWSVLSVVAELFSALLILGLLAKKTPAFLDGFFSFVSRKALLVTFAVALLATIGSLIYSDVIGYDPCKLCWFQRIFMYPLVAIFAVALWKKHEWIKPYGIVMSVIGAFIAAFHYLGQIGWNPLGLECLAIGYSSSCAKNFVLEFGYITIPMMALSAFILIALTLAYSVKRERGSTIIA
jgi:disulfide bond formation protein DsbB